MENLISIDNKTYCYINYLISVIIKDNEWKEGNHNGAKNIS